MKNPYIGRNHEDGNNGLYREYEISASDNAVTDTHRTGIFEREFSKFSVDVEEWTLLCDTPRNGRIRLIAVVLGPGQEQIETRFKFSNRPTNDRLVCVTDFFR